MTSAPHDREDRHLNPRAVRSNQFRLVTLFYCVSIAAVVLGCLTAWQRHYRTRHLRAFCAAVTASAHLDAETKSLLVSLAWMPDVSESGLLRRLGGPATLKQIVWKAPVNCPHGKATLYIFDAVVRPVADTPVPLIAVLVDQDRGKVVWSEIAPYSEGFLQANLDSQNFLTVSARANWFHGKGVYEYLVACDRIVSQGDGAFSKFDDADSGEDTADQSSDDAPIR